MKRYLLAAMAVFCAWAATGASAGEKPAAAGSLQLVMFERRGCPWCAAFDREVAPIYARSPEGRIAPLRRVSIENPMPPDLAGIEPTTWTPTFVLIEDGRELGRIRGYAGDEFFWTLLGPIFAKAGVKPPPS